MLVMAWSHISRTDERLLLAKSLKLREILPALFLSGVFLLIWLFFVWLLPLVFVWPLLITIILICLFGLGAYRQWKSGAFESITFNRKRDCFLQNGKAICPLSNIDHIEITTEYDACEEDTVSLLSLVLADGRAIAIDRSLEHNDIGRVAKEIAGYIGLKVVQKEVAKKR